MMKHLKHGYVAPAILYFTTFLVCTLLAIVPSCGTSSVNCSDPKNASSVQCLPHDISACAQAEAKLITNGQSVSQYAFSAISKLTAAYVTGGATAVLAEIGSLIASDGEQLVSCVIADYTTSNPIPVTAPPPASGSGSGGPATAAAAPSLQDVLKGVVADKKWPLSPAPAKK